MPPVCLSFVASADEPRLAREFGSEGDPAGRIVPMLEAVSLVGPAQEHFRIVIGKAHAVLA